MCVPVIAFLALIGAAFLVLRPAILGAATLGSLANSATRRAIAVHRCHSKWRRFKAEHPEVFA